MPRHPDGCLCYGCIQRRQAQELRAIERQRERERRQAERQAERDARRAERDARIRSYRSATSRPEGTQEAGNTTVDGDPAYYEDGGNTGRPEHRDRYSGPEGPFGPGHHHDGSEDGGETWERYH